MMNNNKILTVSYGTFSCTLEGFDDSFGTMKAIAEYFRDLAADDRYFGAEPPQPDAEMLARIAQKEVSRRVEARQQDGKIVLSALADHSKTAIETETPVQAATAEVETPEVAPETTTEEKSVVAEAPVEEQPVAQAPSVAVAEPETLSIETAPLDFETLTQLAEGPEITVSEVPSADPVEIPAEAAAVEISAVEADDEDLAQSPEAEDAAIASVETADDDEKDIVPGQPDADVEAFFADSPQAAEAEEENLVEASDNAPMISAQTPAIDSIAAKLQRIRAVVAQQEAAEEDEDYLEDEHAAASAPSAAPEAGNDVIAQARADIEEALDTDDETEVDAETTAQALKENAEAATETADPQDDDDINGILSRLESEHEEAPAQDQPAPRDVARQDPAETLVASDAGDVEEDTSVEDSVSNLFDEAEESLDQPAEAEAEAEATAEARTSLRKTPHAAPAPETRVEEKPAQPAAKRTTRVIKVKRADLEAAIEKGDLEEYGDDEALDTVQSAEPTPEPAKKRENPGLRDLDDLAPARGRTKTALSAEDEAELARELAALEDDISTESGKADDDRASDHSEADLVNALEDEVQDDAAGLEVEDEAPVSPRRPLSSTARRALPSIDEDGEADMNRILAETDQQMDEPESATRRDAFAHLRAAVAAKKADVAAGAPETSEETNDQYRSDLAEVVRPRRPVSTSSRTERPADARPAPLKLVAEQRIDVAKPRTEGPVRPRRVAATAEVESDVPEGESFTDFAADMGATTLPQLLEAAAAYMSFVEGREQFSRPQLMSKVRQANGDEGFSREDGLRSFGQLLRTGKIEKIKAGRFTVSDEIGYRPDQRAAG
ncbi:putative lipoprotein [Sulfitobacter noctilucae]|uniref:hypothetical protein n=1 Tax=Sulfitobacter noctilucae TaxID=1342302 RepID=UPI00046A10AB|nr:hypothetical protein [Sulfitobacter noctilucae]KIN61615.1 putative lipoprotein [Sulfitobacter noctilucae]